VAETLSTVLAGYATTPPATPSPEAANPTTLPFWVVVINPRRQPPRAKFVFGYARESDAEGERARRQAAADEAASQETARRSQDAANRGASAPPPYLPFRFHVVNRPPGGKL
jgi:hypothetical protein